MKYLFPAVAAMALAGPALAQTVPQPAAAEPATEEANNPSRMVCKKDKATGTRVGSKKICMTASQWAQRQRDERQATERTQTSGVKRY